MNIFFRINSLIASLMNNYPEYDVSMEEIHHIHKLDIRRSELEALLDDDVDRVLARNCRERIQRARDQSDLHATNGRIEPGTEKGTARKGR